MPPAIDTAASISSPISDRGPVAANTPPASTVWSRSSTGSVAWDAHRFDTGARQLTTLVHKNDTAMYHGTWFSEPGRYCLTVQHSLRSAKRDKAWHTGQATDTAVVGALPESVSPFEQKP